MKKKFNTSLAIASIVFLSGCAGSNTHDPYENYNRKVYAFNTSFDKAITKPVAEGYKFVVPDLVRRGFGNAFRNINEPRIAAVDLTQAKPLKAVKSLHRFVINSTFGLAGFIDLTQTFNLPPRHNNNLGTTLAVYGWKESNYFVIPFMGPSTPRDGIGTIADMFTTPYNFVLDNGPSIAVTMTSLIQLRSELLDIDSVTKQAALDPYVFQRESYLQYREQSLRDQGVILKPRYNDDEDDVPISELAKRNQETNTNSDNDHNTEMSLSDFARMKNQ